MSDKKRTVKDIEIIYSDSDLSLDEKVGVFLPLLGELMGVEGKLKHDTADKLYDEWEFSTRMECEWYERTYGIRGGSDKVWQECFDELLPKAIAKFKEVRESKDNET